MDFWHKYKSPLGYYNNDNQIDSYGVNHSGFSILDELNYQTAREERENLITKQLQNQGVKSLPQYGTNFWNKSADNNYGFGVSDIEIPIDISQEIYTTESAWGYPNNTQSPFYQKMGKPYEIKPEPQYQLGTLSALMEARKNPTIIGTDNAGGPSYGLYQIATTPGTMNSYIKYLQQRPKYQVYADRLNDAGGNKGAVNKSKQFVDMWTELSKDDSFNQSQLNFIVDTHLTPLINKAKFPEILNLEYRHPVVKDALYSISVQHYGAPKILNDTLHELYQNYGKDIDDELFLRTLYKNRTNYVRRLPESEDPKDKKITKREKYNIINNRYPEELTKAIQFLK